MIFMRMGRWLYDRIWASSASSVWRGFVEFVGIFGIESAGVFSAALISVVCAFCAASTSSCVDFFAFLLDFAFVSFACLVLVLFLLFWGVSSLATSLGFGVDLGVEISCGVFSV